MTAHTALASAARDASALPVAGGAWACAFQTVHGTGVAFTDTLTGIAHGCAVARAGRYVVIETKWKRQRVTETTREMVR
jgi:hypothetical protein